MAVPVKKWSRIVSMSLLGRYPIINALTFIMLLSERAKRERHPPIDPNIIYSHIGVMIGAGLAMGFNIQRKTAAISHVVQLFVLGYTFQTNGKMQYKDWLRTKMCLRMIGVAGFVVLYTFFTSPKPRPQYLRRIGETIVGLYVGCYLYQLLQEPVEKEAFLKHALGGMVSLYICSLLLATIAMCYFPGYFVNDVTHALVLLLWFTTVTVDCRMYYWTKRMGVDYWNQVRMVADHFAMMLGCIMYITCTKKVSYENSGHDSGRSPEDITMAEGMEEEQSEEDTEQEAEEKKDK